MERFCCLPIRFDLPEPSIAISEYGSGMRACRFVPEKPPLFGRVYHLCTIDGVRGIPHNSEIQAEGSVSFISVYN